MMTAVYGVPPPLQVAINSSACCEQQPWTASTLLTAHILSGLPELYRLAYIAIFRCSAGHNV